MLRRISRRVTNATNDVAFAAYTRTRGQPVDAMQGGTPQVTAAQAPAPQPRVPGARLSEEEVYGAFHKIAQRAVFDAVRSGLLTKEQVADLDPEIMFVVPALAFSRAADICKSDTLAIPFPDSRGKQLTLENCPAPLAPLLQRWRALAPRIKRANQKALQLYLAGRGEESSREIKELASGINGLAIEITQRRTYQARLNNDLHHVLNEVDAAESPASPSRHLQPDEQPSAPPYAALMPEPSAPPMLQSLDGSEHAIPESPELNMIRETLYGAIADELDDHPELGQLAR